jgi:transcriptional regulator with XRE-family HTH domain
MIERSDTEVVAGDEDSHEHRLSSSIRRRAADIDRHVAARIRVRRIMLGLTQGQLAELIGVAEQQVCKYETGRTRVAAGRLYYIARALGVDVGYFFEGTGRDDATKVARQERRLLDLARDFVAIPSRRHQEELISLARALAEPDAAPLAVRASRRRVVWPG